MSHTSLISSFTAYIVVLGSLYQIGFWREFSINIFEYADIFDVVSYSIHALIASSILLTLGVLLSKITKHDEFISDALASESLRGGLASKIFKLFIITSIVVLLMLSYLLEKYLITGIIFSPFITYFLLHMSPLQGINIPYKREVIYILTTILCISYGLGQSDALSIINNSESEKKLFITFLHQDTSPTYRYLGKAGNHLMVFNEHSNATEVIHINSEPHYAIHQKK
jgi:hypothetical protein